ncbi:unnamed protein product [Mycena citricolor]|uniref:Class II aldolase/adducin N-terminal domain-containing protein n=1 Tax=Mycena citricolor TaxID=2018698 RepID=A0AAD2K1E9_9AGAR|nr:unnamed protein product [Mycena citricolor]
MATHETPEYLEAIKNLSLASKILAHHGVVDGFGHVSCRDPRQPHDHFLLSRNLAPALVEPHDIVAWRIDNSEPTVPDSPRGFLERCIHSEIYKYKPGSHTRALDRLYPAVAAVVHFHSPDILPFGLLPIPFKPVYHMASFLGPASPPVFEIRDAFGPATDMLIRDTAMGAALAGHFRASEAADADADAEPRPLVLMRGHGATLVASSLKLVVYRAVYTQHNARILTSLSALAGGVDRVADGARFLNAEECRAATRSNEGQITRAWDVWVQELNGNV